MAFVHGRLFSGPFGEFIFVTHDHYSHRVLFFFGALGTARLETARITANPTFSSFLGKTISIEGIVSDAPDRRDINTRLTIRAKTANGMPVSGTVLALAPQGIDVSYGDIVKVKGELVLPEAFDTGVGRVFNYPAYLAVSGILFQLKYASVETTARGAGNPVVTIVLTIKQLFLDGLAQSLPEPEAGLAGGITVGDKRAVGSELSLVFQAVGLIHIVVLSGYNITTVMGAAASIFSNKNRKLVFAVSVIIALFFIFLSGGAASATRAACMALIAVYARLSGRLFNALGSLLLVACGMVLWNPLILAFDPGFQLSVLATLGLILFSERLGASLWFIPKHFGFREIVSATLSTQLLVLPLLLYTNGRIPLYTLPANILALVVMPVSMFFSALAALAGAIVPVLSPIIGFPAFALLWYVIHVAETFAVFPFASTSMPAFSAWWLILVYGLIALYAIKKDAAKAGRLWPLRDTVR